MKPKNTNWAHYEGGLPLAHDNSIVVMIHLTTFEQKTKRYVARDERDCVILEKSN